MVIDVSHERDLTSLSRLHERALAALTSGVAILAATTAERPIIDVNPGFAELTRYGTDELLGHSLTLLFGAETAPDAIATLTTALRDGTAATTTLILCRADGTAVWCELRLEPVRPNSGHLTHFICLLRSVEAERRAQAATQEARAHVHLLFSSHPNPMWIFDPVSLRILDVNEAATAFYGYSRDEFLKMTLLDIRPREDRAALSEKARYVVEHPGGIDRAGVWRHRRKDGSVADVEVTTHALTLDATPVRLAVMIDMTERERVEAAWRASEDRLQAILDNTGAIAVIKDVAGQYLTVNRPFAERFHVDRDDAFGLMDADIFPPQIAAVLAANDRHVINTGTPLEIEEVMGAGEDRRTYLSTKFPLRDRTGQIYASCTFATDITERKRAEALQRLVSEASAILSASLDNVAALGSVAELVVPDLADACLIDLVEDTRLRLLKVAHRDPAMRAEMAAIRARYPMSIDDRVGIAQVIRTGQPILHAAMDEATLSKGAKDNDHLRRLLQLKTRSSIIAPMVARGRVVGALTLVSMESGRKFGPSDVSLASDLAHRCALAIDNARLYSEAQAAVRARDQFLSIAAHELRTPVAGIKGYSQMLLRAFSRNTLGPDRLRHALETINHASERLAVLTNDLLDVSRIRLGQLPLRLRQVDLTAMTRGLPEWMAEQYPIRPPLRLDIPATPCWVAADSDRLEQVLTNLLDNAVKYSPEESSIAIRLTAGDDGYLIKIRDEGIGLPVESLESIFEPFGRAANATARNLPGLGLGLHISRSIIERHGGRIWAESAGDSRGTTMAIWLPGSNPGD